MHVFDEEEEDGGVRHVGTEEEEEWDKDFGPETNSVVAILNIVSAMDILQDIFSILIGLFWTPLLVVAVPMLLYDLLALWIVNLEKPFVFF